MQVILRLSYIFYRTSFGNETRIRQFNFPSSLILTCSSTTVRSLLRRFSLGRHLKVIMHERKVHKLNSKVN